MWWQPAWILRSRGGAPGEPIPVSPPVGLSSGWVLVQLHAKRRTGKPLLLTLRVTAPDQLLEVPLRAGQPQLARLPDARSRLELLGIDETDGVPPCRLSMRRLPHWEVVLQALRTGRLTLRGLLHDMRRGNLRVSLFNRIVAGEAAFARAYADWIERYDAITPARAARLAASVAELRTLPTFSVLVPIFNTEEPLLRAMIESVRGQIYPHWQLCLSDDASTAPHVRRVLEEYAGADGRIVVAFRPENGHIAAASNSALDLATGAYCALLDHDDVLAPHALLMMARAIDQHPDADLLYSDEDKLDRQGRRYDPYFKPDFGPDLLYGQNYISHLGVYRTALLRRLGGFRSGFDGSQDYDLALRAVGATKGPIVHVPHVLYHWRLYRGAGTFSSTQRDRALDAARRAIREHLAARGDPVDVVTAPIGYHSVLRPALAHWPRVSVIVPTRDQAAMLRTCIDGLRHRTDYPDLEIIVIDNASVEPATRTLLAGFAERGIRVLPHPGPFNFSAMNNAAARAASGDILLLMNNDVAIIAAGWLKQMVIHAMRPDVGAVGARLLYPNGSVQHGGVVLGLGGVAGHIHLGAPRASRGYFGRLSLTHDVAAVTAACLAVPAAVFAAVGGFDAEHLPVAFNDVDLCLRIRAAGLRVVWTPDAELYHWESRSRPHDLVPAQTSRFQRETATMRRRWRLQLANDPFFSPNLSLASPEPVPAFPPRVPRPWQNDTQARPDRADPRDCSAGLGRSIAAGIQSHEFEGH